MESGRIEIERGQHGMAGTCNPCTVLSTFMILYIMIDDNYDMRGNCKEELF
jgi:hypothetical protein